MDGLRKPSTIDIAFQKRPGSEQLNCCSVNAARGFGLISQWALMTENDDTLVLNWYGPSTMSAQIAGTEVTLEQQTDYPRDAQITIKVKPQQPTNFKLKLRIPQWSAQTVLSINGKRHDQNIIPGAYLTLDREWQPNDEINLHLDLTPHLWPGEKECAGKVSLYRGPILLACNLPNKTSLPTLTAMQVMQAKPKQNASWLALEIPTESGPIELIDYASAGANGIRYATWLPMKDLPRATFSKSHPLPTVRVTDMK
jgi:DUF1680 family protein